MKCDTLGVSNNYVDSKHIVDENRSLQNQKKIDNVKKILNDEFYTICSIGRYDAVESKQGKAKKTTRDNK